MNLAFKNFAIGDRIDHPPAQLQVTWTLLVARGWRDHYHADSIRHDPAMRVTRSSSTLLTPLVGEQGLASQPTPSRFTSILRAPDNLTVLCEGRPRTGRVRPAAPKQRSSVAAGFNGSQRPAPGEGV